MSDRSTRKTDEKSAKDLKKNYSLNSSKNREKRKYTVKTAANSAGAMHSAETGRHMSDSLSGGKSDVGKMKKSAAAKGMTDRKAEFEQHREISPEMQERMKRAAYIKENMQESIKESYKEEFDVSEGQELKSDNYYSSAVKEERKVNEKTAEKTAEKTSFEQRREISPEMRERIKKAAYIKENLQKDIAVSRLTSADETAEEQLTAAEMTAAEDVTENSAEEENTSSDFHYLGNLEHISENQYDDKRKNAAVKNAYEKEILKTQTERRKNTISMNSRLETNAALLSAQRAREAAEKDHRNDTAAQGVRQDIVSSAEFAAREINAVKSGDAAKVISQPVVNTLRSSLSEKAVNAVDDITSVSGTVQNSDSVGSAAANMGINLVAEQIKRSVRDLYISRDDKEKAEKRLEEKLLHIDRKTNEKISRIQSEKAEAMNGNISKRLEKKLSKIENKQEKYKEKLAKKQKEFQRNQQKEIYIKHNRTNPSFAPNVIKNSKTYLKKKTKAALVGGGAVSAALPIFVIIIVFLIIAAFFSWLNPFKFVLAGAEEEKKAETEEEILDSYILEIQNYMDAAQMRCWITYGKYCDARYGWSTLVPDWDGYYEKVVKPQIEAATKSIQESYREALASSKGSPAVVAAMVNEIQEAIKEIIEKAREDYQKILDDLNDIYGEPQEGEQIKHFDPPANTEKERTEPGGGKNDVWDVGEYNGKTCSGTNRFEFGSLNFNTDMSAEDVFILIALSRALDVINNENGTGEGEENENVKKEFAEITTDEINDFFEKTEFIQIEAHLEKGTCDGRCRRKLVGDWDSGWSAEYYCIDPEKPDEEPRHNVLSGRISIKSKDEMIETVMDKYNAEGAGITRKDCDEITKYYQKYIDDTLGKGSSRLFGKNDTSRAKAFYDLESNGKGVPNIGIWRIDTPLETDTDKKEEVKDDKKTA